MRVYASTTKTTVEKMVDLIKAMNDAGVSEHVMFLHFIDYLPAADSIEMLLDLAKECDFDDEDMEYFQGIVK